MSRLGQHFPFIALKTGLNESPDLPAYIGKSNYQSYDEGSHDVHSAMANHVPALDLERNIGNTKPVIAKEITKTCTGL